MVILVYSLAMFPQGGLCLNRQLHMLMMENHKNNKKTVMIKLESYYRKWTQILKILVKFIVKSIN